MVFNEKFDYPFPIMVDSVSQSIQAAKFSSESVFNITLAKLKSPHTLIFNMDILKK